MQGLDPEYSCPDQQIAGPRPPAPALMPLARAAAAAPERRSSPLSPRIVRPSRDMLDRRLRQDAVAEVEDERPPRERCRGSHRRRRRAPRRRRPAAADRDCPARGSSGCSSRACASGTVQSSPSASTPVSLRDSARSCAPAPLRKADDRRLRMRARFSAPRSARSARCTQRSNWPRRARPAQLSKICTTSAPASIWRDEIVGRDVDQQRRSAAQTPAASR